MESEKKSALFVCLGNICRSPLAEAIFRDLVKKQNKDHEWEIDSAAVGAYHIGKKSDKRSQQMAKKYGIPMDHTVRQVNKNDFQKFQYIFGFDDENISDLQDMKPKNSKSSIELLGKYDPGNKSGIIEDPYYSDPDDVTYFEIVYAQSLAACKKFLENH